MIVASAGLSGLFYSNSTSKAVMSFWWQQVECHLNAPLQHRQTGRWSQRPPLPKPRTSQGERKKEAGVDALASQQFKTKSTCSIGLFSSVHSLPLHVSPTPLCQSHYALILLSSVASFLLWPSLDFYLLQLTRCSYFSPSLFVSYWM